VTIALGAFFNALGILLGALFGLVRRETIPARMEVIGRGVLGAATIFFGLRLVYENLGGTFLSALKQLGLVVLSLVLGNALGRLLKLQKLSNSLGRVAARAMAAADGKDPLPASAGFNACAILFCAAPLGWVGAVVDGLSGYFYLLAIKGVMDGLAMTGFVKMFRWPCALSAVPVFVVFNATSFACHIFVAPFLNARGLTAPVHAAAGLVTCAVALVIFQLRKIELANYLPALVLAPLLAAAFR